MDKQINKVPIVRFPVFKDDWKFIHGNELFKTISNKKHDSDLPILAISQEFGAIPRHLINYNISVTANSVSSYKVVDVGDFIISLRSFQGGIEYSNYKGICSPAYTILRPTVKIEADFYKSHFKSYRYIQQLQSKLEGIRDGKMISYKYFSEIKLPFPQIKEQKRIANFFTIIDKKLTQLKEKQTLLEQYKKGMMQKIFSQKLRFKDDNGQDFTKRNTIVLGEIVKIKSGNSPSKYNLKNSGTTPFIKVEELNNCNKNIRHSRYYTDNVSDTIPVNSIIFPKRGGAILTNKVRINSVPLFMDSNLMALICDTNQVNFQFLFYKIVFQKLYKIADTSTIPQINNKHIQPLILELPSLSEQTKIANFLTKIDAKINVVNEQIGETKQYKKALLQQMFCN